MTAQSPRTPSVGPRRAAPPVAHRGPHRAPGRGPNRTPVALSGPNAAAIADIAGAVPDPELPMISLANLGVLRAVAVDPDTGHVTISLTPTYSGCPAIQMMSTDVAAVLADAGYRDVTVRRVLSHAWSSDDVTDAGRRDLHDAGIAPPPKHHDTDAAAAIRCPLCGSKRTQQLSEFGSTSCKALFRCLACHEPFDYFKAH